MAFVVLREMDKHKIIASEGVRSMWQTLLAAAFYTLAFILLAIFFFDYAFYISSQINIPLPK
ncbi:hypothetical protein MWU78_17440 [Arenibacter sp. F26102]|uniref:hypothetical protein n=1 Tax=Arenibacter sp. F26102 TaxID=2926416 RepID=UPI001FF5EF1C|nr:hypothetical protein [Arenibacter sp. F26102]MCK0147442.1 hypothetical protein [Arenibacter sp. F26102]